MKNEIPAKYRSLAALNPSQEISLGSFPEMHIEKDLVLVGSATQTLELY